MTKYSGHMPLALQCQSGSQCLILYELIKNRAMQSSVLHNDPVNKPHEQELLGRQFVTSTRHCKQTQGSHSETQNSWPSQQVDIGNTVLLTQPGSTLPNHKDMGAPFSPREAELKTAQLPHQTFGFPAILREGSRKFESAAVQPHISHYWTEGSSHSQWG